MPRRIRKIYAEPNSCSDSLISHVLDLTLLESYEYTNWLVKIMRTAQTYTPTKEKLLDAAQQLMLSKGFPATTVDEICDTAGFTKGSFFHYFESKEQLGKEVLNRFYVC